MKKYFWVIIKIVCIFLAVKLLSLITAYLATLAIPQFGNRYPYFDRVLVTTGLPGWLWSWGGFDGVHYLRIAQNGYSDAYYQAFFPLFPLIIRYINFIPKSGIDTRIFVDPSFFYTGIILSNVCLLASLTVLYRNTGKKHFFWQAVLLLSFPTAFYFGAIYTESLFLLELLLFIGFLKKKNYLAAAVVGALASATRFIGLFFWPILFFEIIKSFRIDRVKPCQVGGLLRKAALPLIIAPSGFLIYALYLKKAFGSYLSFMLVQSGFGADRSALPVALLPQVFYRYIKMLLTVKDSYQLFSVSLELIFALVGLIVIIWAFNKIDFGWWLFLLLSYLAPTLTGTFSSMPRYIIFAYIILIPLINKLNNRKKSLLVGAMIALQVILTSLFTRGYWIS